VTRRGRGGVGGRPQQPKRQRLALPTQPPQGIINRDGCLAEYVALPVANLHVVPAGLRDNEAAFAEPLAAAARIVEQGLVRRGSNVAVIGAHRGYHWLSCL
jgi:threonine dehydrogenase-like Zn-dependent dehydrogenase